MSGADGDTLFRRQIDDLVEQLQRRHTPLAEAMPLLLPLLRAHLGAASVFISCPDESLRVRLYRDGARGTAAPRVIRRFVHDVLIEGRRIERQGRRYLVGEALDFAGQKLGAAGVTLGVPPRAHVTEGLHEFCEQVDGYVGGMMEARQKQQILVRLSKALQHPVLESGVRAALAELRSAVDYASVLLVYVEEAEAPGGRPSARLISEGSAELSRVPVERLQRLMLQGPRRRSGGGTTAFYRLLERLGIEHFVHEQLITGLHGSSVLGELVVSKHDQAFSTFELDVIKIFQGLVRLRLVDFNRERRGLLRSFSPAHAHRLLSTEGYLKRYLTPRRRSVAIVFADLDSFTSLSERPDMKPEILLDLVDRWASGARDIVHDHQGVLDKVIGDCVLALFGPPFFSEGFSSDEEAIQDHCRRALAAAIALRDFTETIKGPGGRLRTGTGLSVAPLAVGMMSVGDSYTGYGRGMNETARLQDLADGGVILVSEAFRRRLGPDVPNTFGPLRQQKVSGVSQPLPFRQLLG